MCGPWSSLVSQRMLGRSGGVSARTATASKKAARTAIVVVRVMGSTSPLFGAERLLDASRSSGQMVDLVGFVLIDPLDSGSLHPLASRQDQVSNAQAAQPRDCLGLLALPHLHLQFLGL